MKNFSWLMLLLILATLALGYYFWPRNTEQDPPMSPALESPTEEIIIFEANLPEINNSTENNFFVMQELQNKNIKVIIREERGIKEIPAEEFKKVLLSANEIEGSYANEKEYFVIQTAVLGSNPEIGIVHQSLDPLDFAFSSGYVLEESLVSSQNNICISTSAVYNNWACFIYNSSITDLEMSYAQNFAD